MWLCYSKYVIEVKTSGTKNIEKNAIIQYSANVTCNSQVQVMQGWQYATHICYLQKKSQVSAKIHKKVNFDNGDYELNMKLQAGTDFVMTYCECN